MATYERHTLSKLVIAYEAAGFFLVILVIWLDELIDLPYLLLGAAKTPLRLPEAVLESGLVLLLGIMVIAITRRLFKRLKYLEGILPICASCKKIRDENGTWHSIEYYIRERSAADFSHSICPKCAKKLYPEFKL